MLAVDALAILSDQLEHRPELGILVSITSEASERVGAELLRRWLRAGRRGERPLDTLLARDFPAFEERIADLIARGFVLRGGSRPG